MDSHICSSCHLLFLESQLCPEGEARLLKRTQREVADVHFLTTQWREGGREGGTGGSWDVGGGF